MLEYTSTLCIYCTYIYGIYISGSFKGIWLWGQSMCGHPVPPTTITTTILAVILKRNGKWSGTIRDGHLNFTGLIAASSSPIHSYSQYFTFFSYKTMLTHATYNVKSQTNLQEPITVGSM